MALAVGYGGGSGVRLDNGICYRKGGGNSELALGSGAVEAVGSRGPGAVVVAEGKGWRGNKYWWGLRGAAEAEGGGGSGVGK